MMRADGAGQIVVLNGTPRSGKSSIAAAMQRTFVGVWMNLGVDRFKAMTPEQYQPGIGLRPGGERPDLEPLVALLYRAMYESIAAHSRMGLNVVVDAGHHDAYSLPRASSLTAPGGCAACRRSSWACAVPSTSSWNGDVRPGGTSPPRAR